MCTYASFFKSVFISFIRAKFCSGGGVNGNIPGSCPDDVGSSPALPSKNHFFKDIIYYIYNSIISITGGVT